MFINELHKEELSKIIIEYHFFLEISKVYNIFYYY